MATKHAISRKKPPISRADEAAADYQMALRRLYRREFFAAQTASDADLMARGRALQRRIEHETNEVHRDELIALLDGVADVAELRGLIPPRD